MKKKLPELILGGVVLLLALVLAVGIPLARPRASGAEADKFIGFHLVPERINARTGSGEEGAPIPRYPEGEEPDRTHWEEYGQEKIPMGTLSSVSMPRMILKGVWMEEEHRFDFPGLEGYNCFLAVLGEENDRYITGYTDMTENTVHTNVTEQGEEHQLTSTLYMGSRRDPYWVITAYRVYQMEDGTVYLDGSGSSYGGPGFTIREKTEYTAKVNGKSRREVLEVEFTIRDGFRLEEAAVLWFDGEDTPVGTEVLDLERLGEEQQLTAPAGAVWGVVRELDENGKITRTPLNPDHEGNAFHKLITLDERGLGRICRLRWNGQ